MLWRETSGYLTYANTPYIQTMNKRYKLYRVWYYYAHQTVCITSTGFALCFVVQAKTAGLGVTPITSLYGDKKEHLGKLLVPLVLYQI